MVVSFRAVRKRDYNRLVSIMTYVYIVSILFMFVYENESVRKLPFQISSFAFSAYYLTQKIIARNFRLKKAILIYIFLTFTTGLLNHIITRNSSYQNIVDCAVYNCLMACVLIEYKVNIRFIEFSVYTIAIYFFTRIVSTGLFTRLIGRYSNNQVSVLLLIPTTLYYALADVRGEKRSVLPALLTWILSLLSRGRSGIFATSMLIFLVIIDLDKNSILNNTVDKKKRRRNINSSISKIFIVIAVSVIGYYVLDNYAESIFSKFVERGVDNSARNTIWSEYLESLRSNLLYVLLGSPKDKLLIGREFGNNTHNSFLSIHANNGLIVVILLLFFFYKAIRWAVRNHKWLYISCLAVFSFRSFYDNAFWGTWGTTVFLYLLFVPLYKNDKEICDVAIEHCLR